MKHLPIKALLTCFCIAVAAPSLADHYEDEGRRDRHEHDRYEHEHYREREHHRHDHGYRESPCRVEGWHDRYGYYHEREVCPEPGVVIQLQAPPLPLPPGIPLPPGLRFR